VARSALRRPYLPPPGLALGVDHHPLSFLGTPAGAVAAGRVPLGVGRGNALTSWWNTVSVMTGVLAVVVCAYVAAVHLSADPRRSGDCELVAQFRRRALGAGVVAGKAGGNRPTIAVPYRKDRLLACSEYPQSGMQNSALMGVEKDHRECLTGLDDGRWPPKVKALSEVNTEIP
jgi:hypothetical protein